jgi:Domain of unknown function (DUF4252)
MHNRIAIFILCLATAAAPALAQTSPLPLPSPVEKELAARATKVSEVTLDKNMLGFASGVMNNKNGDESRARRMLDGLDGIYVRSFEFDKPGEYHDSDIAELRKHFETSEWTPIVRESDRKTGEVSDVMVKMVNGQSRGLFILSAEPRELSIVLLLGNVNMNDLGALKGLSGMNALGETMKDAKGPMKDKDKLKDSKGQMKDLDKMKSKDKASNSD